MVCEVREGRSVLSVFEWTLSMYVHTYMFVYMCAYVDRYIYRNRQEVYRDGRRILCFQLPLTRQLSRVMLEENDVTVLHQVLAALLPQLAGCAQISLATVHLEVLR